jgi:hypothetical protein
MLQLFLGFPIVSAGDSQKLSVSASFPIHSYLFGISCNYYSKFFIILGQGPAAGHHLDSKNNLITPSSLPDIRLRLHSSRLLRGIPVTFWITRSSRGMTGLGRAMG